MYTSTYNIPDQFVKTVNKALTKAAKHVDIQWSFSEATNIKVKQIELFEGAYGRTEERVVGHFLRDVHVLTLTMPDLETANYRVVANRYLTPDGESQATFFKSDVIDEVNAFMAKTEFNYCEHCRKNRGRNDVFIIKEYGCGDRLFQVGGSCRQYYIPDEMVRAVVALSAAMSVVVSNMTEETELFGSIGSETRAMKKTADIVTVAIRRIEAEGFKSTWSDDRRQYGTADWVADHVLYTQDASEYHPLTGRVLAELRNPEGKYFVGGDANYDWIRHKLVSSVVGNVSRILRYLAQVAKDTEVPRQMPTEGRVTVEGTVISTRYYEGYYGTEYKMLVDCGAYKLFGSVPSSLTDVYVGDKITMTATVEAKELGFGYFKRPTKAMKVTELVEA